MPMVFTPEHSPQRPGDTTNVLIPLLIILALLAAGVYYALADVLGISTSFG